MKLGIVTDCYWPVIGGEQTHLAALARLLPATFERSVITHMRASPRPSLWERMVFMPAFDRYTDPAGTKVHPLLPSILGRFVLLPLLIWNMPFVRRLCPHAAFSFLYLFYKGAFYRRLAVLIKQLDCVYCVSTGYLSILTGEICRRHSIALVQQPTIHFGHWGDSPRQMR